MPNITVRGISNELHKALKAQAKSNGQSMEAEVRSILEKHVTPQTNPLVDLFWATRDIATEIPLEPRQVIPPRVDFSE
ncbi:FitA-like ribbon-helix-helix domain-containing protein [Corynebacterium cystitidis]|uniref:Plasmid stability protein n=1 Tax=Corynebacterium cystitidis DSM 20524 TaxID=1121357 RepID=A0A1H9QJV2_9CORY|nr:hypothetical protein [Corynebacterium cystitidis]WJY81749.1 hypothetical protein CCYS_03965 [Corynebacterium cystitidis DSM 20524]SER60724.1 Plasmid stability protein [Corynebacterium cystitidis DSM 20524]SNV84055.1 plasmid stabilization protein [Corynebacterium cystitidis]